MPCYHPLDAFSHRPGGQSKQVITFKNPRKHFAKKIQLPCGQCIGCRFVRSKHWAIRCVHESQLHEENCFITLTYNEEHLPHDEGLDKSHFQKFMKRFRKSLGSKKIRFYHCGEYGENLGRPHYHAVIFGHDFADKELYSQENDNNLYVSDTLSKLWGKGFTSIGDVTLQSAAYVARYIMKKQNGENAIDHYIKIDPTTGELFEVEPEYTTMSRRPGIGLGWYEKYKEDLYPDDFVIYKGKKFGIPRYYDKILQKEKPEFYEEVKQTRLISLNKYKENNTPERLLVRETIQKEKLLQLKRKLPNATKNIRNT